MSIWCDRHRNRGPAAEWLRLVRKRPIFWALSFALFLVSGCETYSAANVPQSKEPLESSIISVTPCQDRTGLTGERDLASEGTKALIEQLQQSNEFEIGESAPLKVSCDVERYIEGSAIQRWLVPGWGATQAKVKVAIWRMPDEEIIATFQSKAQVSAGGLYTVGAEEYILDVAIGDIVKQMEAWARGDLKENPGKS